MFFGSYRHTIDDKGRLICPADFREQVKSSGSNILYMTVPIGKHYIAVYPEAKFNSLSERWNQAPITDDTLQTFVRALSVRGERVKMSDKGRMLISENLRRIAGIEREVVIVGKLDHLEIWNPRRLDEDLVQREKDETYLRQVGELKY